MDRGKPSASVTAAAAVLLVSVPRAAVESLRALDRRTVKRTLGRYLEKDQIKALQQRRRIVLDLVDEAIEKYGEAEVFFSWPTTGEV